MPEYVKRLWELVGDDELLQIASVSIALMDADRRVLLARHVEGQHWLLPGGAIEPGEVPADAAIREMWEETGTAVRLTRLVGVFGGPDFIVHYRNGHRTSYVMTVFEARTEEQLGRPDGHEVLELRFMSADECKSVSLARWIPTVPDPSSLEPEAELSASVRRLTVTSGRRRLNAFQNVSYQMPVLA